MSRYSISFPHGIMFHHFHDDLHPVGQGSISAEDFEKTILFIGRENIVSAQDWLTGYQSKASLGAKVCITFDDSLKCQMDIAKPVLDKFGIKAFFFVYTSVLKGSVEYLELFRYFRSKFFQDFDDFFAAFMGTVNQSAYASEVSDALRVFDPDAYLQNFSFYTRNDKVFRFLRDRVLKVERYNEVLLGMINERHLSLDDLNRNLWMSSDEVKQLHEEGHVIGLHSDTHPTTMAMLPKAAQAREFFENKSFLEGLLESRIVSMSHPCNSYNNDTLSLLKDLGVEMGFRANMQTGFDSRLEIPREDHINVLSALKGSDK